MRRFTILSLMLLVVALAVGIAALRGANEYWAGGLLLATPLLHCTALVGGLCGRESSRARMLGYAVFGGAYFALAFLGLSETNLAKLPTSWLLQYVHQRALPSVPLASWTLKTTPGQVENRMNIVFDVSSSLSTRSEVVVTGTVDNGQPNRWSRLLPGAANYQAFGAVGHCLFALLAGLLGAVIAWRFERGRGIGREAVA